MLARSFTNTVRMSSLISSGKSGSRSLNQQPNINCRVSYLPGPIPTQIFQPLLDRLLATIEPFGVDVNYVFVKCSQAELESRVTHPDRARAGKAHTLEQLYRQQAAKNHIEIPGTHSLVHRQHVNDPW